MSTAGKSENEKYVLEEGDSVVLDLFTNALLVPVLQRLADVHYQPRWWWTREILPVVDSREINALHTVTRTKNRSGKHFKSSQSSTRMTFKTSVNLLSALQL